MRQGVKYAVVLLAGTFFAAMIACLKGIGLQSAPERIFHVLCDAAFAVGTVTAGMGVLLFSANEGTFDMTAYGIHTLVNRLSKRHRQSHETFYDYRTARSEKKHPFGFLLVSGLVFWSVSMVMYGLYRMYR